MEYEATFKVKIDLGCEKLENAQKRIKKMRQVELLNAIVEITDAEVDDFAE